MAFVSVPVYGRNLRDKYGLEASKCTSCGFINFPSKGSCRRCSNTEGFTKVNLSGKGTIYSYTIIGAGSAPPEFSAQQKASGSYAVGIVELDEGPRIVAQLIGCDPEKLKIGLRVEAVFRKIYEEEGVVIYGSKFRCLSKKQ
ncbi:MAG: Zn-ribbon domain-containing OB-fold protein [Thaumarchaeota archaeon]|nr:Zn-ribbon domain-containing OB-fold protein [Nitrososphaerota archaeon]